MFVRQSTYDAMEMKYLRLFIEFETLNKRWNDLVERINAKGGEQFLRNGTSREFDQAEIRTLIKLCHPDKHGGSKDAEAITTKLLALLQ